MKRLLSLAIVALLFTTSCNNTSAPGEKESAEATAPTPEMEPVFTPYIGRAVEVTVEDYDRWYAVFSARDSFHRVYGIAPPAVARILGDDKKIMIFSTVSDLQRGKEYDASDSRKQSMKTAGVINVTTPSYWNVIMNDTTAIPQQERLWISHRVKDFDAWKKVYDAEGDATRAANGMALRMMARGVDDPNMVTMFFAITDMEKVKARVASAEMKKIMTDAGVEGTPKIEYFKWVNQ